MAICEDIKKNKYLRGSGGMTAVAGRNSHEVLKRTQWGRSEKRGLDGSLVLMPESNDYLCWMFQHVFTMTIHFSPKSGIYTYCTMKNTETCQNCALTNRMLKFWRFYNAISSLRYELILPHMISECNILPSLKYRPIFKIILPMFTIL